MPRAPYFRSNKPPISSLIPLKQRIAVEVDGLTGNITAVPDPPINPLQMAMILSALIPKSLNDYASELARALPAALPQEPASKETM